MKKKLTGNKPRLFFNIKIHDVENSIINYCSNVILSASH